LEQDFNTPQRQSAVGIVVMFANTLQKFLRNFWALLIVLIYKMPAIALVFVFLGVVFTLLLIGVIAYLQYLNFTFFLDQDKQEFVVQHGVLDKKRISISLDKIQQVNIDQSVLQRLIGVYSLDIDTAGSGSKEVSIKAIDHKSAQILKEKLLKKQTIKSEVIPNNPILEGQEKESIRINFLSLLKFGITSNYGRSLGILTAFFFTVYDKIKNFAQTEILSEAQIELYINRGSKFGFLILFFILFFVVFVINLTRIILKYYDLKIIKQQNSLALSFGLLAKKNTLLNPKKIQIVSYVQNFFQRKMNVLKMKIKQASSQEVQESKRKNESSSIEIIGVNELEKNTILQIIYNKAITKETVFKPNYRFVFRGLYLGVLFPIFVFLFFVVFLNKELIFLYPFIILYIVIVSLFVYFRFLNHRLFVGSDFVVKKSGAWDVEHEVLESYKIQAITTKQYFWHKRSDVGHLILHTASGDIYFRFAKFSELNKQINHWLYQVETSTKYWM